MSMSKIELWESLIVAQIVVKCGDTDRQTDEQAYGQTDGGNCVYCIDLSGI